MRPIRTAFLAGLCVLLAAALSPSACAAQGVNVSWSRCFGEGLGARNRDFACDTNAAAEELVCSFVLPANLAQVTGNEIVIDLLSQADPLPAWWDLLNLGSCRPASLTLNTIESPADVVCVDWASGTSVGGIASYGSPACCVPPALLPSMRRIKAAIAVPVPIFGDLLASQEYFSGNIRIDHAKTVGTGACAGCAVPACLILQSLKVTTSLNANDVTLTAPASSGSNVVTWQGSGADCNLVPVRNRTWGQVKALYR